MEYKVETIDKHYDMLKMVTELVLNDGDPNVFKTAVDANHLAQCIRSFVDEILKETPHA